MRHGLGNSARLRLVSVFTLLIQSLLLLPAATAAGKKGGCDQEPAWYGAARRRAAERKVYGKPVKVIRTGATWYGPGFHGRRTASGERFNQNAMTLASRHLPFGTRVRVVNPKTGKSAVARVNDRGPFGKSGYTADLSKGLAHRIGLLSSGPVRLEILDKAEQEKND